MNLIDQVKLFEKYMDLKEISGLLVEGDAGINYDQGNVEFLILYIGGSFNLDMNISDTLLAEEGAFICYNNDEKVPFLERFFKNPLIPTEEELVLFELENGFKYLIPAGGCL